MITDKQAQIAVDTIIKYCQERYESYHDCKGCALKKFCDIIEDVIVDNDGWQNLKDYSVVWGEEE